MNGIFIIWISWNVDQKNSYIYLWISHEVIQDTLFCGIYKIFKKIYLNNINMWTK